MYRGLQQAFLFHFWSFSYPDSSPFFFTLTLPLQCRNPTLFLGISLSFPALATLFHRMNAIFMAISCTIPCLSEDHPLVCSSHDLLSSHNLLPRSRLIISRTQQRRGTCEICSANNLNQSSLKDVMIVSAEFLERSPYFSHSMSHAMLCCYDVEKLSSFRAFLQRTFDFMQRHRAHTLLGCWARSVAGWFVSNTDANTLLGM